MFGDSFFTILISNSHKCDRMVFVPMFGDSFFTRKEPLLWLHQKNRFRPHVWGFFFHLTVARFSQLTVERFRPHVWGFFFHYLPGTRCVNGIHVFVPMFGDPFFTAEVPAMYSPCTVSFRPHVWGSFFHAIAPNFIHSMDARFSSPCLGILFSPPTTGRLLSSPSFSSPCLGILFSQQTWDAPRGGLSMALLRRGFPIDWISHYFHPLTFCFLRFHAHRRGFSKYE